MKRSLENLKKLLEAAIRCTNWDLKVFEYEEEDVRGLYVAPKEDDTFQVIVIPVTRDETVKTIAGERVAQATFFNIYTPKYDAGDRDVGLQGGYYTDIDEEYTWSFKCISDVAVKVMSWIVEFELDIAVSNEAEYLDFQESEAYFNEEA